MKWDHVRVFLAVARQNRLSTAGKYLALDTSTVGRHIDQLEANLQTRLPRFNVKHGQNRELQLFCNAIV